MIEEWVCVCVVEIGSPVVQTARLRLENLFCSETFAPRTELCFGLSAQSRAGIWSGVWKLDHQAASTTSFTLPGCFCLGAVESNQEDDDDKDRFVTSGGPTDLIRSS